MAIAASRRHGSPGCCAPAGCLHHFHFAGSGAGYDLTLHAHGDSQCHEAYGGVSCLQKSAPPGHAWFLRDQMHIQTEFNDVRPAGSAGLSSWVLVAWKTRSCETTSPLRQLRLFYITMPLITGYKATYVIPTQQPTVVWSNGSFTTPPAAWSVVAGDFQFVNPLPTVMDGFVSLIVYPNAPPARLPICAAWPCRVLRCLRCVAMPRSARFALPLTQMHTHSPMVEDMWLMQGRPEQIFADVPLAMQSFRRVRSPFSI